ncbi:MAG: hypothetical protein WDO24_22475 [Pseudomonadota bacterium]
MPPELADELDRLQVLVRRAPVSGAGQMRDPAQATMEAALAGKRDVSTE